MPLEVEESWVESFDGTRLAYHQVGDGPPLLLANGLGGSWRAWTHQIEYFKERFRFVSWDYRGLYRSSPPADRDALGIPEHAEDGLAVMDAAGDEQVTILGWSMGVQVALEMYRQAPERVKALVLLNGVAGSPWSTAFNAPAMVGGAIPAALSVIRSVPQIVQAVTERVTAWPDAVRWAKRIGLAGQTLDEEIFAQLAGSFAGLDMDLYLQVLEELGEHDAYDLLPQLDVPVLVIAGDRDVMTPRAAAERMVAAVPRAELLVIPGGTHYAAAEYPQLINLRIEKFFRERSHAS